MKSALARYDGGCRDFATLTRIDVAKDIRDKAVAMRVYARQAKNINLMADAREIQMRATRRIDQLRRVQKQTVGLAKGGQPHQRKSTGLRKNPVEPTLASQDIDKNLANQARKLGRLTDAQFETAVSAARDAIFQAASKIPNIVKRASRQTVIDDGCSVDDLQKLIAAGKKFATICADPPWSFRVYSGKGKMRSAERHFDTQTLDEIKALPVAELAADDCALLLWAVMPQLPEALELIKAWGFNYKTAGFVWIKQNRSGDGIFTGMGYWTRANAELCLLATKGAPTRLAKDVHQVVMSPVGAHSRKPDEVQVRVERLLPGPYLELYGRRVTPGWTVWGNEIVRSMFHQEIPEFSDASASA